MAAINATPTITVGTMSSLGSETKPEFSCSIAMEYASQELAQIVLNALAVDAELQPDKVSREMNVNDCSLHVRLVAVEPKYLRASLSAFMDLLVLATKTVEQFELLSKA